jgi:hypothetical protein
MCAANSFATTAFQCAEEDSNLHPVIPDQALNLVTRLLYPSYASTSSRTSGNLDASDAMDDLVVVTDVATDRIALRGDVSVHDRGYHDLVTSPSRL